MWMCEHVDNHQSQHVDNHQSRKAGRACGHPSITGSRKAGCANMWMRTCGHPLTRKAGSCQPGPVIHKVYKVCPPPAAPGSPRLEKWVSPIHQFKKGVSPIHPIQLDLTISYSTPKWVSTISRPSITEAREPSCKRDHSQGVQSVSASTRSRLAQARKWVSTIYIHNLHNLIHNLSTPMYTIY